MKKVLSILLVTLILSTFAVWVQAQPSVKINNVVTLTVKACAPAFKIIASSEPNSVYDVEAWSGLCTGPCWDLRDPKNPTADPLVSVIAPAFSLTTALDGNSPMAFSYGALLMLFNNSFGCGWMYNTGRIDYDRPRTEFVFTIGPGIIGSTQKLVSKIF